MNDTPYPGRLIEDHEVQRDAIHVALAPATASVRLSPGQHVGLVRDDDVHLAGPVDSNIGIVDPFLTEHVEVGQRFWLFLYPNTVTGLRHIWTHPAFNAAAAHARAVEKSSEPATSARSLRDDFLEALAENEDDLETRMVFSDWLDEQGEHDEAERHRKWPAAKQWLLDLVQEYNRDEDDPDIRFVSYEELLEFGFRAIEEESYTFGCGSNMRMCDALREHRAEFWRHWSVISGIDVPDEAVRETWFSCAC